MATSTTRTNKPIIPRGQDASPLKYNRAALYSGKALDFDGVNDQIIVNGIDSVFDYGNAYTMAAYFKIVDTGSGGLMGNSTGNAFGDLQGFIYKNGADSNFYPDGNSSNYVNIYSGNTTDFVHIVCTSDGTTAKAYLNGQLVGSTSVSSYTNTGSRFNVGSSYSGNFGESESAGVKVFSTALTAAQVSDLYNNPEKIVPTGVADTALKLWLPMMEGAGTTAYDGSGNGNHGTISGATWTHGVGSPVAQTAVIDWNKGQNLMNKSESFLSSYYANQNITVTADQITAPDGDNNGYKFVASNANTFHLCNQSASASAGVYTQSVFAKSGEYEHIYLVLRTDGGLVRYGAKFNLTNGTFVDDITLGGVQNTSYSISDAGNGWYRCSVTLKHSIGNIIAVFGPSLGGNIGDINNVFQGDGTSGIYAWGLQAEPAESVGAYIPNPSDTRITSPVLLPQGLTSGRDITGVNLFENVRKQGALNLDGNSWAEVHDNASLDITSAITLEAWVYNDGSSFDGFLGRYFTTGDNRGAMIYEIADGTARMIVSKDGINAYNAYGTISQGWNHIVGTCDDTEIKIYINGVKGTDGTAPSGSIHVSSYPYEIGRYNANITTQHTNQIAQPRIYNRALTAEEVQRNYDAGKNIYTNS